MIAVTVHAMSLERRGFTAGPESAKLTPQLQQFSRREQSRGVSAGRLAGLARIVKWTPTSVTLAPSFRARQHLDVDQRASAATEATVRPDRGSTETAIDISPGILKGIWPGSCMVHTTLPGRQGHAVRCSSRSRYRTPVPEPLGRFAEIELVVAVGKDDERILRRREPLRARRHTRD